MSEIEHRGRIARVEVRVNAKPAQAWEAWTDPTRFAEWFADEVRGVYRPGEIVKWVFERFDMELPYRVLSLEQGRRLVLGSGSDESGFLLEVIVEPQGSGSLTRVVNSGYDESPDFDEEFRGVESGWMMAFGILGYYLDHQFGKAREKFFAVREARFDYDTLFAFYRDGDKLATWLTTEGEVRREGAAVNLVLRDGRIVTGEVLVMTPREIALRWDEIQGVIELKAFSLAPDRRAVCVRGSGWDLSPEEAHVIEGFMEGALERLVAALNAG